VETGDPDEPYAAPNFPYDTLCVNPNTPDGLRCGARPFTPIAEFYKDNGDGTVTQQMVAGSYGELGSAEQYTASFEAATASDVKEEIIPEPEPGGPCDPVADPDSRKPSCAQLRTAVTGHFHDLTVTSDDPSTPENEGGINGGDVAEFTIDVQNTSPNPNAYLTAFNYQTKRRGLADVGILDGYTQDRRDIRVADPAVLDPDPIPNCSETDVSLEGACYNAALGIGQFPNAIGNGLLFGQMVWQSGRVDRSGAEIVEDFVAVDPENGIDPTPFKLESVKKNGPFTPILKGNTNFICAKSGLFFPDQDADAACAGEPAILADPDGEPVPANVTQRLGLAPGESQSVRIRMEWGDFRGALLEVLEGTLTPANVDPAYGPDGTNTNGLARFFDCEDQRELEFCHPDKVGDNIGYLPNTTATWLTPETLEEIEYVIINQPGDAPRIMNFQQNLGHILAMAGFVPSAEFYAPDPNPDLLGTPAEGILIRQQVLGSYATTEVPAAATTITSTAVTTGAVGTEYTYDVNATAHPGTVEYSLDTAPSGMAINDATGVVTWTPGASGVYDVAVRASNGRDPDAVQTFQVNVATTTLDSFNRANGGLGSAWGGLLLGYSIAKQQVDVGLLGGPIYWKTGYGANQEAAITLTGIDRGGSQGIFLKGNRDHLKLSAISVAYEPAKKRVVVTALEYGKLPKVVGTFPATLANGDRLGAKALADGSVRVSVNGQQVGSANAGSFFVNRSGHIGVLYLLASRAFFDDFGGGDITP
jgi:hypothetical protein